MEDIFFDFMDFMKKPSVIETLLDILLCAVPIWVAVMIGLVIGWSWRPRWTGLVYLGLRSKFRFLWTAPPGFGARRLCEEERADCCGGFEFAGGDGAIGGGNGGDVRIDSQASKFARRAKQVRDAKPGGLWMFKPIMEVHQVHVEFSTWLTTWIGVKHLGIVQLSILKGSNLDTRPAEIEQDIVTENDLDHLLHLLERKDGEMAWQGMMERSTPNMSYQAWRHEPELYWFQLNPGMRNFGRFGQGPNSLNQLFVK
ncbi:hypothetical protein CK203_001022 [Vitis vinifera]|uniref:Uncharacterized protein n=1 Tax=Vitis vinifera TaxID=29760 RepID=A0A438KKE2_VITVI|nr:hypothetical protein CK203_001022 [Vitis vinifera]